MQTTLFLLISYTVIDVVVCEMIEIKGPTGTRRLNSSAILDQAILRSHIERFGYTFEPEDSLNLPSIPWPIARNLEDKKQSNDFEDISDIQKRTPKSISTSAHLPSRTLGRRQIIPAGQPMYPSWNGVSIKLNNTMLDGQQYNRVKIEKNTTNGGEEKGVSVVFAKNLRHREIRRKNLGSNNRFLTREEDIHNPDEHYNDTPENHTPSYYEVENADAYSSKYARQGGRYGSENYNSYDTENNRDDQYYENSDDYYTENQERWPPRYQRPNSVPLRYTVDTYDDPGRGVTSPSLVAIFSAIGSNLLQLFKIGLGSGLSIAIAVIALKLFLIPLKLLKFIKIVKILLKLFFVVPFLLRLFVPSIYSTIGYHGAGFGNKMEEMSTPESRDVVDQTSENPTWWSSLGKNIANTLPDIMGEQKCPSKVACELGSYLASRNKISKKLTTFLANATPAESKDFDEEQNENQEISRAFLRALTQRWTYDRCEVFACGISL